MADRAPAQQRLCDELASLPREVGLPDAATAAWLRAFWATMAREWTTGIDVLRMEKFLLLVRRVLHAQLGWMRGEEGGEKTAAAEHPARALGLSILAQWPLNAEGEAELEAEASPAEDDADETAVGDRPRKKPRKVVPTVHIPVGLTMHVVDIWVDEAEKLGLLQAASEDGNGGGEAKSLATDINQLVQTLADKTIAPAVRQRTREALEDERLPWVASPPKAGDTTGYGGIESLADSSDDNDDDENADGDWDGFND